MAIQMLKLSIYLELKVKKEYIHRITKPLSIMQGRTFKDYTSFKSKHPNCLITQFDTVVGLINDKKRILTIHFPALHFQFGILLNENTTKEVNSKLLELRNKIGIMEWKRLFPIMLSDNGVEFNDFYKLEIEQSTGEVISNVFYCNPYSSSQKGACERNHELFRYILSKGNSFEFLTQEKVDLMFSHINSQYRKSINGIRPIDLAKSVLGQKFLDIINIKTIEPDEVNLSISLIKKIKQ